MRRSLLAIAVLTTASIGCQVAGPQGPEPQLAVPLRCCVIQDLSGSIVDNRVPRIGRSQLEELARLVAEATGEIGFGVMQERSDRTLLRFAVEETPPETPPQPQNPLYRSQWERQRQQAEQARAAWEEQQARRLAVFLEAAEARMKGPLSRTTDVCGAIRRCQLMLGEPSPGQVRRVMMLITDGIHNVRSSSCPEALPPETKLILINGAGLQGVLGSYKPVLFESIDAAIRWLKGGGFDESN